jgi:hypothetical protein
MVALQKSNFAVTPASSTSASPSETLSDTTAQTVFVICHSMAGVSGMFSALFDAAEVSESSADNGWVYPSAISAIVGGCLQAGANLLVPQDPIKNTAVRWIYFGTTILRFTCKAVFTAPVQSFFTGKAIIGKLVVQDPRGVGSIVDAVLALPALACSCWHFYELAQDASSSSRTAGTLDEASNVACCLGRISYAVAVNSEGTVKGIATAGVVIADLSYGGLQVAVAVN